MSDSHVTDLLKTLHTTLEGTRTISDTDRELLKKLAADIDGLLAEPGAGATGPGREGIVERLRAEVTKFEVSHPDLTATLSHVSKALGDMGI